MLQPGDFAFQTDVAVVRPLQAADVAGLSGIYTDPRTQQFVGQLLSETQACARLQACLSANQQQPLQKFYLAVENNRQQLAGMAAGFALQPDRAWLELGIMLLPGLQTPGLAKSAYAGLIQQALGLGFSQVQASMQPQNLAALRLVRQCGMQLLTAGPAEVRYQICRAES
ncbi:MAG: GNAT family N-acetyltransferase [Rheinheimera sp.]|nr:GNAT family N-acetyltransferase [Rheinheimera sp.]